MPKAARLPWMKKQVTKMNKFIKLFLNFTFYLFNFSFINKEKLIPLSMHTYMTPIHVAALLFACELI